MAENETIKPQKTREAPEHLKNEAIGEMNGWSQGMLVVGALMFVSSLIISAIIRVKWGL